MAPIAAIVESDVICMGDRGVSTPNISASKSLLYEEKEKRETKILSDDSVGGDGTLSIYVDGRQISLWPYLDHAISKRLRWPPNEKFLLDSVYQDVFKKKKRSQQKVIGI